MGSKAESANKETVDFGQLRFGVIVPQDFLKDEELKIQERMAAELKKLRAENSALELKEKELQQIIAIAEQIGKTKDTKINILESLLTKSETISSNNEQLVKNLQTEIKILKEENTFLKTEIEKVRKSKNKRAVVIGILAYIAGILSPVKF